MAYQIFVVEDHALMREVYSQVFQKEDNLDLCAMVATAEEAMDELKEKACDLIVIDVSLPGMNGVELVEHVASRYPLLRTVIITGHSPALDAARAAGADAFLNKRGLRKKELIDTVRVLLEPDPTVLLKWTPRGTVVEKRTS